MHRRNSRVLAAEQARLLNHYREIGGELVGFVGAWMIHVPHEPQKPFESLPITIRLS